VTISDSSCQGSTQLIVLLVWRFDSVSFAGCVAPPYANKRANIRDPLQASSNISKFLNLAPQDLLGMNLANLFSKEIVHQLVSGTKGDGERRYVVGLRARGGLLLDALVHRYKGLLIIEFEPANATLRDPDLALESRLKSSLLSQDVLILGRDPATVRQCERLPRAGRFSAGSRLSLCA
jgi:hypothetical protein